MTLIDYWPSLRYENWNDTIDSLHMKLQIIGKVKPALNPVIESRNPEESILKFLNETYDIGPKAAK